MQSLNLQALHLRLIITYLCIILLWFSLCISWTCHEHPGQATKLHEKWSPTWYFAKRPNDLCQMPRARVFQFIQVIIPIHVSRDRKIRADQGADARCINRDSWGWLEVTERGFRGPSAVMSPFCIPRARVTSYLETCRRWGCPPSAWSSLTPGSQTAERERERATFSVLHTTAALRIPDTPQFLKRNSTIRSLHQLMWSYPLKNWLCMSSFCATIHVRKVCLLVYELFESPLSCALITFERVSRILRCTGWESTPNLHELFIIDLDSLSSRLFSLSLSFSLTLSPCCRAARFGRLSLACKFSPLPFSSLPVRRAPCCALRIWWDSRNRNFVYAFSREDNVFRI